MKSSAKVIALAVGFGFAWVCGPAWADTLQMKDARVIQGRFFGGSQANVQFETNGKIGLYNVDDIISVTFTSAPAPSAAPSPSAFAPNDLPAPPVAQQADANTSAYPDSITVPAGADLLVRMIDSVDSDKNHVGDKFRASLEQDFVVNGVVVATKGTDVYGRLAESKEAGHFEGKSELKLELTDILIHNRLQPIMTGDYELSGKSRGSDTAKKVGIGAVAGTVLGAIVGGGKGAAVGAGVGAGAGAGIQLATRGEQVHVPSETLLDFRIAQPFTVSGVGQ